MNDLSFVYYSLKSRWINNTLSVLLTVFGVSLAIFVTQFGNFIQKRLTNDGKEVDIVIGAKGSPLQIVLSSIYHIDIPTGNIPFHSTKKLLKNPLIEKSIPLALGDNWRGYRIVGTTKDYIDLYKAQLKTGNLWEKEFEVVAGSLVDLELNDEFVGAHGLLEGGESHDDKKYKVKGILKSTGSVIDRLLITSLNSVLEIHGHQNIEKKNQIKKDKLHHPNEHDDENDHHQEKSHDEQHNHSKSEKDHSEHHDEKNTHNHNLKSHEEHEHNKPLTQPEITAFLIMTKSPIANINLPRLINKENLLQAANPAVEITRLSSMLGLGSKSFSILSIILILAASLSIFSGLAGNLENRMGDLAILRAIGYSKKRIFKIIALEGIVLVTLGILFGTAIGLLAFKIMVQVISPLTFSQISLSFKSDFFFIIISVFISGLIAAMFPAYNGSKISVAKQLSTKL